MIRENGYGFGYIGNAMHCHRHNVKHSHSHNIKHSIKHNVKHSVKSPGSIQTDDQVLYGRSNKYNNSEKIKCVELEPSDHMYDLDPDDVINKFV
jgi:hypothetical protein